jgi:hypothetical protein
MPQYKLGQHTVRFDLTRVDNGWRYTHRIGLEDAWDDPVESEFYIDRRQAKNQMNRQLKKLRADPSYY